MLTECNFLFGLVGDEEQLLSGICHLIVQAGGFERAWVRLAAGPTDGQPAENVPPTGALHIQKDYYFAASYPARSSSMLTNQHQSCLGLPLKDGLSTLGELNLYNTDIEPLDQQEIGLLNQLAANLAFCLLALRDQQRTARRQTQLSSREPGRQPLLVLLNG
jgi:transcriptional regulator with GAF, ATPase, and Fis domain